ncbi:hypothetical protein AMTR_s00121p00043880 [Amborella trichopoda]|uniref:Uncharacterized protein n=1 Tax=Amborella trichopoda TaxID=13333 RepID=W1NSC3_AMBTC|nr:hypothetical protein AMTR_s00121p00043880 [Amborella trichopoda]
MTSLANGKEDLTGVNSTYNYVGCSTWTGTVDLEKGDEFSKEGFYGTTGVVIEDAISFLLMIHPSQSSNKEIELRPLENEKSLTLLAQFKFEFDPKEASVLPSYGIADVEPTTSIPSKKLPLGAVKSWGLTPSLFRNLNPMAITSNLLPNSGPLKDWTPLRPKPRNRHLKWKGLAESCPPGNLQKDLI